MENIFSELINIIKNNNSNENEETIYQKIADDIKNIRIIIFWCRYNNILNYKTSKCKIY